MLPRPGADVIFRRVGDGAVLLQSTDEVYYGLDPVAARIWEMLPTCDSAEELVARLHAQHGDVPPQRLRSDVDALLDALMGYRLLTAPVPAT